MVVRKERCKRAPQRPYLEDLLKKAENVVLTEEQLKEQQASFVYGNAPFDSRITKESARSSVDSIRVMPIGGTR